MNNDEMKDEALELEKELKDLENEDTEVKKMAMMGYYSQNVLTLEECAEFAEISIDEFVDFLGLYGVSAIK